MAPTMDFVISGLFSVEDNNAILENVYDDVRTFFHENHQNNQQALMSLADVSDGCVAMMIKKECDHMPYGNYLEMFKNDEFDLGASREQILDWICKVHSHFKFGPLCLYLSVNYLDRFLSVFVLPGMDWTMQLLAIACVSIAAKLEEIEVPLIEDLQVVETQFMFDASDIQRMELHVLKTLNWRMQAITPFSFIDYFLKKIKGDQVASRDLMLKATNLIIGTLKGIHFLEFKPSEIAAAVAIYMVKNRTGGIEKATFTLLPHVQEDKVKKCVELIKESSLLGDFGASTLLVPPSPTGVWDVASSSSVAMSDDDSSPNPPDDEPASKRQKMDEVMDEMNE